MLHAKNNQYIPVKLSGFFAFRRWHGTVYELFILALWKGFKSYQSWLILGSIRDRWLPTRSELAAGLPEGSPGQLVISTFIGGAVAGGSEQPTLACATKCTVRLGKMMNHQRSKARFEEYLQSKTESRLPKEIWGYHLMQKKRLGAGMEVSL